MTPRPSGPPPAWLALQQQPLRDERGVARWRSGFLAGYLAAHRHARQGGRTTALPCPPRTHRQGFRAGVTAYRTLAGPERAPAPAAPQARIRRPA
ncbi:hypothetical protein [Deinococcus sonorensis]|uniref:Uncharacterized protein n=1 Tax=Deinococcus sonorensis TaxID=309891 RepID=A0ABV8Y8C4_9DEIO